MPLTLGLVNFLQFLYVIVLDKSLIPCFDKLLKERVKLFRSLRLRAMESFGLFFLLNVTEEVTIHRPNVSTLMSSAFIRGDLEVLSYDH